MIMVVVMAFRSSPGMFILCVRKPGISIEARL
jgi:hypothetical protein